MGTAELQYILNDHANFCTSFEDQDVNLGITRPDGTMFGSLPLTGQTHRTAQHLAWRGEALQDKALFRGIPARVSVNRNDKGNPEKKKQKGKQEISVQAAI